MRYHRLGELPPKRHVQFRENGRLLVEEVLGFEGFSGNESILYHLQSPCRLLEVGEHVPLRHGEWVPEAHVHRHLRTAAVPPGAMVSSGWSSMSAGSPYETRSVFIARINS